MNKIKKVLSMFDYLALRTCSHKTLIIIMRNKKMFIEVFSSLLDSWNTDTPPEAIWTANKILDWLNDEYGIVMPKRFTEEVTYIGNTDETVNEYVVKYLINNL